MLRAAIRLTPTALISIIERQNEYDYDTINNPIKKPETGFDRVKMMFSKNECDELSIELHTVSQSALTGFFFGGCFGGFIKSRDAYIYFIENNQATIYKSTADAKKKLQDYVTMAFVKGAYSWGWRLGLFTGIFSFLVTTISVYRGDTSLIYYAVAGALTGAIFKANLGLAASLVGAGLGAVLSTMSGLAIFGILKVSGLSITDIKKAMYKLKLAREDQYKQAVEKASTIKNDDLTRHHETVVKEWGERKIEELN